MTDQVPEIVRVEGEVLQLPDFLCFPLAEAPGVTHREGRGFNSSCWRGYVATWELREGRVWLASLEAPRGLEGQWELRAGPPLPASWVSGLYRLPLAGRRSGRRPGSRMRSRPRGPAVQPARLLELEVHEGVVLRQRQVPTGRGGPGRAWWEAAHWKRLPGAAGLFARRARQDPDAGCPQAQHFLGVHLREAFARVRERAGLSYGDVMQRAGRKREAGGQLAEWERGQRRCDAAWVRAVCDAAGMPAAQREQLEAREQAALQAAFERWQGTPLRPQLTLPVDPGLEDLGQFTYEAPLEACASEEATLGWARACCALAWRPGTLRLSRAERVRLDGHGHELERVRLGPRAQP